MCQTEHGSNIIRQGDGRQRALANDDRMHELDGHMLGVRRRTARAEDEQAPAPLKTPGHRQASQRNPAGIQVKKTRGRLDALRKAPGGQLAPVRPRQLNFQRT